VGKTYVYLLNLNTTILNVECIMHRKGSKVWILISLDRKGLFLKLEGLMKSAASRCLVMESVAKASSGRRI